MLQLDSYDLVGDNVDREVEDFISRFIPTESFRPWLIPSYPGWNTGALTTVNGDQWGQGFKLNRLWWPGGASRFSYAHYLCNSDTVGKIAADAYGANGQYNQILLSVGNPESNSSDGSGTINAGETFRSMVYMLPPTPLSGIRNLTGMIQSLYLITVVDERYFWPWQNWANQMITSSTTWMSLIQAIQTILNLKVPITIDMINPNYLNPSVQAYTLPYEPITHILDSIAWNIGMRFIANGLQVGQTVNTYSMQLYPTAYAAFNNDMQINTNRNIISGGQRFSNPL